MCIGIDSENHLAVLAPYYIDDEDSLPELHVEDGVQVFRLQQEWPNIKPLKLYKGCKVSVKISAEVWVG